MAQLDPVISKNKEMLRNNSYQTYHSQEDNLLELKDLQNQQSMNT